MKHDNTNDNRINGFYKATKTNAAWSEGKQYYFRDGYTVDDDGDRRPYSMTLEYRDTGCEEWLKDEGLVPATDEMDIFDRVNEAAVNCVDDQVECVKECPYHRVPNCKDQMIDDFKALRKMRENRKEHEHEAMPIQGGFVYSNKRKSNKSVIVGSLCRDKGTLEVYTVTDISFVQFSWTVYGIRVDLKSIDKWLKIHASFNSMDDFYEQFELWECDKDGGSFDFVALEDLSNESDTRVFKKGHLYSVVEGRVCNCDCDMRFRDLSEMAAYFGGGKLIRTVGQGHLDDPTEGLYTGMAVFKGGLSMFTKGKIYRFVNGIGKDDTGRLTFWKKLTFADYFMPVKNLKVE